MPFYVFFSLLAHCAIDFYDYLTISTKRAEKISCIAAAAVCTCLFNKASISFAILLASLRVSDGQKAAILLCLIELAVHLRGVC